MLSDDELIEQIKCGDEQAVPCEATLEDLYLYYFPTEEGVQ